MSQLLGVRQRKSVHGEKYNIGCCWCEGLACEYDAVGVGATLLIEGRGEEVIGGAVGPGDGGGEATVDERGWRGHRQDAFRYIFEDSSVVDLCIKVRSSFFILHHVLS